MHKFDNCSNMLEDWAEELAKYCQRPVESIRSHGLMATDFTGDIEVSYGESRLYFQFAFCLINQEKQQLAIFTEHEGYHIFPAHNATVYRVNKEWQYSWPG